MANSYDSALVEEILSDVAITTLGPVLAKMDAFSLKVEPDPIKPRAGVAVELVNGGSTVLQNATDFESGDADVDAVLVAVNQQTVPFHASNDDMQKGHDVRRLLKKNMQNLGNKIQDVLFAPLTAANYGAAVLDLAGNDITKANLQTVWAAAENFGSKNLFLAGSPYSQLIPQSTEQFKLSESGAYGFDSIHHTSRFTGAESGVVGFVADSDAIAVAAGVPKVHEELEQELTGLEEVVLPNGVTVQLYSWVSCKTRSVWRSLDVMIGAAVGDPEKVHLIEDTP